MFRRRVAVVAVQVGLVFGMGCVPDLDTTREAEPLGTFGEILYQEGCQRVAYTAQLDERERGERDVIDVNGSQYATPVCHANLPAPDDAPQKLKAIQGQRNLLIASVDRILPKDFLPKLDKFLLEIIPLHEDGTMEETMAKTGAMLGALRDDPEFTSALSRLSGRVGYRPVKAGDLVRTVVQYPKLDDFLGKSLDLLTDKDGRPSPELNALLVAVSAEMRSAKASPQPSSPERTLRLALDLLHTQHLDFGDGNPRPLTARDWRGMAQVALDPDTGKLPAPFVDNNGDGLADIDLFGNFLGANGKPVALGAPFPQAGLADKATRDPQGRLLDAKGRQVFRYLDLDPTLLAAVTRETSALLDPNQDTLLGLLHGANALLGARVKKTAEPKDARGAPLPKFDYQGFALETSPLLDLVHAFLQILGDPSAPDTLLATRTLLDRHESQLTRVIDALFSVNDLGKKHPDARVPETSTIYDDLVPIIVRVLRVPGLVEDIMNTLEDPHVGPLVQNIAHQLTFKDRFILDQNSKRTIGSWATPVDYKSPDVDWNRSVMQRMAHMIADANGAQFCNKDGARANVFGLLTLPGSFKKCEMFRIDDLGLFFVLMMADKNIVDDKSRPDTRNMASFREHITDGFMKTLVFDSGTGDFLIEQLTGIDGFSRFPTPPAGARALFIDKAHQSAFMRDSTEPVVCVDGDRFDEVHNDSIFAWEVPTPGGESFYTAVKPLINAFARHDECLEVDGRTGNCTRRRNAAKIFVDLMSVLHRHWGSPKTSYLGRTFQSKDAKAQRYSAGDDVRSYERITAEALTLSDLVPALVALSPTLNRMTLDGTNKTGPARPALVKTLKYLFDGAVTPPEVAYRDGQTQAKKSDGTPAGRATPYYLLADAFARKRAALAAAVPEQAGAWRSSSTKLVDQMLTIEKAGNGWRMKSRRFHGVHLVLIDFLRERLRVHTAAGDRAKWIHRELTGDITRVLNNPVFAALADLTGKLEAKENDASRRALYDLLGYLVDQARSDKAFQAALTGLADNVQLFLDDPDMVPVSRAIGAAIVPASIDPSKGAVETHLRMMKQAKALDPNCVARGGKECTLVTVIRNLFAETPSGVTPVADLADAIAEVNRNTPGAGGAFRPEDYRDVLGNIEHFLTDEQRGFMRFVRIVKNRRVTPESQ